MVLLEDTTVQGLSQVSSLIAGAPCTGWLRIEKRKAGETQAGSSTCELQEISASSIALVLVVTSLCLRRPIPCIWK
jgi:hypothetical protein